MSDLTDSEAYAGPVTVIEAQSGWGTLGLVELWRFRDLLVLLVRRDFAAQYRQSVLGVGWAFINPVFTLTLNVIVFSKMANFSSDGIPYPVFNMAALLLWDFFAGSLSSAGTSVASGRAILTKVYFPRLIFPLAKVASGLITLLIRFVLLVALMAWYGMTPSWTIITLPLFIGLAAMTALSVALWLTALDVKYRDTRRIINPALRFWMFATPVVYSITMVPEEWRFFYCLNPMVGVIEGFRWAALGQSSPDWTAITASLVITSFLFSAALYFFRKAESTFADFI